jgi:hypothetical protein
MIFCQRKRSLSGLVDSKFYVRSRVEWFLMLPTLRSNQINKITLRHYMNFFDFGGLRLDNGFRFVSIFGCTYVFLINFTGDFVANCILKPKLSRWIASWNSSVVDIGTVIPTAFMAAPVRLLL